MWSTVWCHQFKSYVIPTYLTKFQVNFACTTWDAKSCLHFILCDRPWEWLICACVEDIAKRIFWKMFSTKFYALSQNFISTAYLVLKLLQNIIHSGGGGGGEWVVTPPSTSCAKHLRILNKRFLHCLDLNTIFLNLDRMSSRNDATLDRVNFKADIKQSLFWRKNRNDWK